MRDAARYRGMTMAAVLSGGAASRFGSDKTQEMLDGQSLLDRTIAFAGTQAASVVIADGGQGHALPDGLTRLVDADFGAGPARGLCAALAHAAGLKTPPRYLLTLPCDVPFYPHDLAGRLIGAVVHDPQMPALAVSGSRLHPAIAVWPVARASAIIARVKAGENALHALLGPAQERGEVRFSGPVIDGIEIDPFFNVNTPEELEIAREVLQALAEG
ncbi:MAG: molybdenum cofactor guanylyltransferase [Hyphomicrobiaceae bacterium]|nr:molybdenum cofactor guanylyltransferase [Hyphomicrobiaceae bacterium]